MTTNTRVLGWSALFSMSAPASCAKEADHIVVQHILVGFSGSIPGKPIARTKDDAKRLAFELLRKAKKKGFNFAELVVAHTDDAAPGIYKMSNRGVLQIAPDEFERGKMVPGFGDAGFSLRVGQLGFVSYDPRQSPFGYHIIKRIK